MYGFVPYNLSPIQQGIQFGHAVVEYTQKHFTGDQYQTWAKHDKTFIILNGGTTNSRRFDGKYVGTLNQIAEDLNQNGITRELFYEPDLGDCLTAVVFLVDDRAWDKKEWPDYGGLLSLGGTPADPEDYWNWKMKFLDSEEKEEESDKILFLREFISKYRLA